MTEPSTPSAGSVAQSKCLQVTYVTPVTYGEDIYRRLSLDSIWLKEGSDFLSSGDIRISFGTSSGVFASQTAYKVPDETETVLNHTVWLKHRLLDGDESNPFEIRVVVEDEGVFVDVEQRFEFTCRLDESTDYSAEGIELEQPGCKVKVSCTPITADEFHDKAKVRVEVAKPDGGDDFDGVLTFFANADGAKKHVEKSVRPGTKEVGGLDPGERYFVRLTASGFKTKTWENVSVDQDLFVKPEPLAYSGRAVAVGLPMVYSSEVIDQMKRVSDARVDAYGLKLHVPKDSKPAVYQYRPVWARQEAFGFEPVTLEPLAITKGSVYPVLDAKSVGTDHFVLIALGPTAPVPRAWVVAKDAASTYAHVRSGGPTSDKGQLECKRRRLPLFEAPKRGALLYPPGIAPSDAELKADEKYDVARTKTFEGTEYALVLDDDKPFGGVWVPVPGGEGTEAYLYADLVKRNAATTSSDGKFALPSDQIEDRVMACRVVKSGYHDGVSAFQLPPTGASGLLISHSMRRFEHTELQLPTERQVLEVLESYDDYTYQKTGVNDEHYPVDIFGTGEARSPTKITNCNTFVEGLLVATLQELNDEFSWPIGENHNRFMIEQTVGNDAARAFGPVDVMVEHGFAEHPTVVVRPVVDGVPQGKVLDDDGQVIMPEPWSILQGWSGLNAGHCLLIVGVCRSTRRVVTLEANYASCFGTGTSGVGHRALGRIADFSSSPIPADWNATKKSKLSWDAMTDGYAYGLKMARLKINDLRLQFGGAD